MMDEFKQKWPAIKTRRRVEVHINSLSIEELKRISMEKFLQREKKWIERDVQTSLDKIITFNRNLDKNQLFSAPNQIPKNIIIEDRKARQ